MNKLLMAILLPIAYIIALPFLIMCYAVIAYDFINSIRKAVF
jgi:hypothetical protein